jgi:3',5'-cyclic AMP phosphodiesterase CpdA
MEIVQVSDLHFGNHNVALQDNLVERLKTIRPDLVIATGDLVDTPNQTNFQAAHDYLIRLAGTCKPLVPRTSIPGVGQTRPQIIAIPGNHDYKAAGFLDLNFLKANLYDKWFSNVPRDYYFEEEGVWVYGFDSALEGLIAGGKVPVKELAKFHQTYDALEAKHGERFRKAFKIAVIHHHPLPVNWDDDWKQITLLMENSGAFLAAALNRKMNLVLHGHEHLQGRSRLRSTLGGKSDWELVVVSLGATLRKVSNPIRNWFNLISIGSSGEARLTSYPANQMLFLTDADELDRYPIRSIEQANRLVFDEWKTKSGFVYQEVISITRLDVDGDAERFVECIGLETLDPKSIRVSGHDLQLPQTTGEIVGRRATALREGNLAGITITPKEGNGARIDFGGRKLQVGERVGYKYFWRVLNAFAMDERQYKLKYESDSRLEFTHLLVCEPIETLRIVVKFPENFCPASPPEARVTRPIAGKRSQEWPRDSGIEYDLRRTGAVHYIESVHTAILTVARPESDYYYGIQWQVPPRSQIATKDKYRALITEICEFLVKASVELTNRSFWLQLLEGIGRIAQAELLERKPYELEVGLMAFDEVRRVMVTACAVLMPAAPEAEAQWLDYAGVTFPFGAGLAGRAFKSNECRLYVKGDGDSETPHYYQRVEGLREHSILLSIPIRSPADDSFVFATLNLGCYQSDCPLRNVAAFSGKADAAKLRDFQGAIENFLVKEIPKLA